MRPACAAGAAGAGGTHRGRTVGDHPARAAARVHPPGAPEGSRPGPRPPCRRVGLLPFRRGPAGPGAARIVACPEQRKRRPVAAAGRRARCRRAGTARRTRTGPTAWPATWSATTRRAAPGRPWRAPRCHCWKPATCWTSPPVTACWPNWSPHAKRYICIDTSARVVAAASERLRRLPNVEVREGDMHALPFRTAASTWWC